MKKKFLLFFLLISGWISAQSGPSVTRRNQLWLSYSAQAVVAPHWGILLDLHYRRTDDFVKNPFVEIVRPGLSWLVNDNFRVTAGYAYVINHPAAGKQSLRPEHRPWQQIWWRQSFKRVQIIQQLRFEQRFVRAVENDLWTGEYDHVNRVRFNTTLQVALTQDGFAIHKPQLVLSDEIMVNTGPGTIYNVFDQNRAFLGIAAKISSSLTAQLGYLNVYQQQSTGKDHVISHVIRFAVSQQFDFGKKEK